MRSFKKIAAMIMAVAMLCSFTVLADETVALIPVEDTNSDSPVVTLGYDWDATSAAQTTMVLFKTVDGNPKGDIVYIDQFANGADSVELNLGNGYGDYTLFAGGMDVATAVSETFSYEGLAYDVNLTSNAGGRVAHEYASLTDIAKNTVMSFDVLPFIGYEIENITVNEVAVDGVVKTGHTLRVTVTEDVAINVTFAKAAESDENVAFTDSTIHDLPADTTSEDATDCEDAKLVFGKVSGADVAEAGMFLEKWDDAAGDYVEYASDRTLKFGPHFKAEQLTIEGEYGIRFVRFAKGSYRVRSYVKDTAGNTVYGAPRVFEVK